MPQKVNFRLINVGLSENFARFSHGRSSIECLASTRDRSVTVLCHGLVHDRGILVGSIVGVSLDDNKAI